VSRLPAALEEEKLNSRWSNAGWFTPDFVREGGSKKGAKCLLRAT